MDTARFERMQTLFHEALALPESERARFLQQACAGDADLLADLQALLLEDARENLLLDGALPEVAYQVIDGSRSAPQTIGPYRVQALLGEGGMGLVYLAERKDLNAKVAIKVLRDALLSPVRQARFIREQQFLAQLNHPAIARLYDADTLPDGTPYFVMEYVEGTSLTSYCRAHKCPVNERLRLFREVGEAVKYAHGQALIHRDLKPSNILVKADGQVKLLDFGIAKQLEDLDESVAQTKTVFRLMTPAYAAPEQINGEAVGVYTDVYALGVVLYELLTGQLPYDLSGLTPGQVDILMLRHEPEKPSVKVQAASDDLPGGPLPGRRAWADLDVLCLTAMHKDIQRRYPTVEALLRDLDHYLNGEPLEARPDALGYRMGKFLRRNRIPASATALVVALLIGLVGFYTQRLASARDTALNEAARTQRVQSFLVKLFEGGDETVGPSDSLRVVTLVDRGVQEARVLDGEPEIQAELLQTLGGVLQKLGNLEKADTLLQAALDQRRALFGSDHPDVAKSLLALGLLRMDQGNYDEAERMTHEALEINRRHLQPRHPDIALALSAYAVLRQRRGENEEAIGMLAEAARLLAARGATADLSEVMGELANAHFYAGHFASSDSLNRRLLDIDEHLFGNRHPFYATDLINLAATRRELGYPEEAEKLYRQALAINLAYHGPDHPTTASNLGLLGAVLADQGRYEEAGAILQQSLAVREKVYGPTHVQVALTLNKMGQLALVQGDLAAADALYSRQLAIYRATLGERHYWVATGLSNLCDVYLARGELERAERAIREALAIDLETLSADHLNTGIVQIKLGRVLLRQGRFAEAEGPLLVGYDIVARQANPSMRWLQQVREDLVALYEALGAQGKAEKYRAEGSISAE